MAKTNHRDGTTKPLHYSRSRRPWMKWAKEFGCRALRRSDKRYCQTMLCEDVQHVSPLPIPGLADRSPLQQPLYYYMRQAENPWNWD